jgi:hypothetical protein
MLHEQIMNKTNSQNTHDLEKNHNLFIILLITSGEATSNWQKVI